MSLFRSTPKTPLHKRENREHLLEHQATVKAKLKKGKVFYNKGTYVNEDKTKPKTSFTEELRNQKGYAEFLKKKHQ